MKQAVLYYCKAAEQRFLPAICNMSERYYYGQGVEKDLTKAVL